MGARPAVLSDLADDDPERIVDDAWDPPVTLAARLVSLVNETTQHVGQVGYAPACCSPDAPFLRAGVGCHGER